MRWYTCITKSFAGNSAFFARDSGLLSRGFRKIGVDSAAIMPGERRPDDEPDLIRTEYANLEDPAWWRSHRLDGVVLYSWGLPTFTPVAKAIREAGIFLILNQDSSGVLFPLVRPWDALRTQFTCYTIESGPITGILKTALWTAYRLTVGFARLEFGRASHLALGDVVSCVSPVAAERYRIYLKHMGKPGLGINVKVIPHPVADYFGYDPSIPKESRVISIGRWDDHAQKRPHFLAETITLTLRLHPSALFDIIGNPTPLLQEWYNGLEPGEQARVNLLGKVPNDQLPSYYSRASVLLCPSSHESFHIPAAEALCTGSTVVAPRLASLASFEWFCEDHPESLANDDTPRSLADALLCELTAWESGARNPKAISEKWISRFHSTNVCHQILEAFRQSRR